MGESENIININDIRTMNDFKKISFSGFEKTKVTKELIINLINSNIESSLYWSVELICSGHFKELWECIILFISKHIHIGNPKLPIYLAMRIDDFKNIVKNGFLGNELDLRNNGKIRKLFAEIIIILSLSNKKNSIQFVIINKENDFSMENLNSKLKAPNVRFITDFFKDDDPQELFIALNELTYNLSINDSYNVTYWIEWILEYEIKCKKNKIKIECARRNYPEVPSEFQKDCIWIIWEIIKKYSENKSKIILKINDSLFKIYSLRFTPTIKKKRKYILYYAINILTENYDLNKKVIEDIKIIENLIKKMSIIYKQVKTNEKAPATDYLFNTEAVSNLEKTREKLQIMNKIFDQI